MSEPQTMPAARVPLVVRDTPQRSRYEATLGDDPTLAGFLDYALGPGWIALRHTEVQEDFEGQGVGSRLVRSVLDDVRRRGLSVIPQCPFVVAWLQKHPEQQDILARPLAAPTPNEPPSA